MAEPTPRGLGWVLVALAAVLLLIGLLPQPVLNVPDPAAVARAVPDTPEAIDAWFRAREAAVPGVKPGTEAQIRWADGEAGRAPLALLVLHGFSASPAEIRPLPDQVADALGAHVVYVRLRGHGRSGTDLGRVQAGAWLDDAERGYVVASRIADRVVLLGSSTGSTLALWLQHRHRDEGRLLGAVHLSPNLGVQASAAEALLVPGLAPLITTVVPDRCFPAKNPRHEALWTRCYDTSAVVSMMALVDRVRDLDPARVRQPTLVIWNPDDDVLDTGRIQTLAEALPRGTAYPYTPPADGGSAHVLAGDVLNPAGTEALRPVIVQAVTRWQSGG